MKLRSRREMTQGRRAALDRFVDRGAPLELLQRAVLEIDPAARRIVNFHGMSGQGKSLLVRKFIDNLENNPEFHQVAHSLIDLSERTEREAWRLPVWIRNDLAEQGIRFRAFDVGFELYWAESFPETPAPFLSHRWLRRLTDTSATGAGELATTIFAQGLQHVLASVPFVGLAVGRLGRIAIEHGTREYLLATNDALKELFRAGKLKAASELEAYLPFLLAADLETHREHKPDARFVVLIDEYERCLEQGGGTDQQRYNRFDSMVRDLVAEMRATLFVITGREALRWAEIDDSWAEDREPVYPLQYIVIG
jgi:hypothetical protein